MGYVAIGTREWAAKVACESRMAVRKYRNTGDREALERHVAFRMMLAERGYSERFGLVGWDDALTGDRP